MDNFYSERDILQKAAAGDAFAFRQLFDRYSPKIYSFSMHLTRSDFISEEITQEVFLKIWVKRRELAAIDYFYSYLRTIAKNVISNYLKRMAHEKLILQRISNSAEVSDLATQNAIAIADIQQVLLKAIHQLPPQQKKVYLLSRQEGLKYEAIAEQMHISPNTVKEYMKKALHSIRSNLRSHVNFLTLLGVGLCLFPPL